MTPPILPRLQNIDFPKVMKRVYDGKEVIAVEGGSKIRAGSENQCVSPRRTRNRRIVSFLIVEALIALSERPEFWTFSTPFYFPIILANNSSARINGAV